MATAPVYMSTMCVARASLTVANTNRDGTGTIVTPTWGGTAGGAPPATDWLLKRIFVAETGDAADSVVTIGTWDGSTYLFLTDIDIGNPAAASATVTGAINETPFVECAFPANWDLRFAITAAPASGAIIVHAFCERA